MVDVGLTGISIRIDKKRNELNYGHGITADDILLGNVAPPSEFSKLFDSIGQVSNAANMAAFVERSTASTTQVTMSRLQKHQ
jgi:lipid-binding SYLF domain-containing protein